VVLVAALMSLPVLVVLSFVLRPAGDVWRHLADTVLGLYAANSLWLMLGVSAGVLSMGVSAAWLTTMCRFPGRRTFEWAMLLPLAMPAYIIAYTYTGMLDFAGPVQTTLRDWFGWGYGEYWFPQIRSLGGAMVMLSLVLYPYVYLLARAAFLEQPVYALDASRTLGCSPWQSFWRVALPAARPGIVAGLTLALMETLADYGTVQYFGVATFTTGIFRTWFGLGDAAAAAQLSAALVGVVLALVIAERWSRRRRLYAASEDRSRPLPSYALHGARAHLAVAACALPVVFGFVVPAAQLAWWALRTGSETLDGRFLALVGNTVSLAALTALLAVGVALALGYGRRRMPGPVVHASVRVAGLGYAIPGTVIAVGVMLPFAALDNALDAWARAHLGVSTGLLLSGTLAALVFAYLVRFLAVALASVEAGLGKITGSMDEAARGLGCRPGQVLRRVHVPIMRGSLLTAGLLVFVDVMKELPATLILRPFDFNTLAVRAWELASDERLADSSTAALAIVVAGFVPVVLLTRSIAGSRRREAAVPALADALPASP